MNQPVPIPEDLELLLNQVLSAQEELRGALARELHNELGALLTGMSLDLSRLLSPSVTRSDEVEAALDSSLALLREAVILKRHFIERLYPSALDLLGITVALEILSKTVGEEYGLRVESTINELAAPAGAGLGIDIYRVAEAALENVVRHAAATSVQVILTEADHWLVLVIRDDGTGFDVSADAERRIATTGIPLMRHRLRRWNGELHVESRPGLGATVTARVPLVAMPA